MTKTQLLKAYVYITEHTLFSLDQILKVPSPSFHNLPHSRDPLSMSLKFSMATFNFQGDRQVLTPLQFCTAPGFSPCPRPSPFGFEMFLPPSSFQGFYQVISWISELLISANSSTERRLLQVQTL